LNNPADIQKCIGIQFKNNALLKLALTHSSYVNEYPAVAPYSNERLEFLGDAVLDMLIAEELYLKHSEYTEGELTELRAALVCTSTLAGIAKTIELGNCLLLGKGEEASGGRFKEANLAGGLEALVAAVYLDKGLEITRGFLLKLFETELVNLGENDSCIDFKSRLQHIYQARKGEEKVTPVYSIVEETGPDHNRVFTAEVKVGKTLLGRGTGKSKKFAETEAAKAALEKMK
jgi:ribonuclease III